MTTTTAGKVQYDIAAVKKRILRNLVDEAGNEIKDTAVGSISQLWSCS